MFLTSCLFSVHILDSDSKDELNGQRRLAAWKVFEKSRKTRILADYHVDERSFEHFGLQACNQSTFTRLYAWILLVFDCTYRYYEIGWIRAIGVSNWTEHHIEQLTKDGAKVKPMVNQIEANMCLQWSDIRQYCQDNAIVVQAFSPLGHGGQMLHDETVRRIADKHTKDVGQVAMRYLIEKEYAVTFSTTSEKWLVTNQQVFDFALDAKVFAPNPNTPYGSAPKTNKQNFSRKDKNTIVVLYSIMAFTATTEY